jgi:uncharacterized protein (TIGR03066 family)
MFVVPAFLAVALFAQRESTAPPPALAGTWVLVKGSADLPKDVSFVTAFHSDGSMLLRFDTGDPKRDMVHKGKYKLDGVKLAYSIATGSGERTETLTVKSLTSELLVVVDPEGKVEEFRRDIPKKK